MASRAFELLPRPVRRLIRRNERSAWKGLLAGAVGGLVGTIAMTLMMMFVAPMMGVHMNIAKNLADMMGAPRVVGMVAHFMLGTLLFPGIFVLLYKMLPGAPIVKEMIWASARRSADSLALCSGSSAGRARAWGAPVAEARV